MSEKVVEIQFLRPVLVPHILFVNHRIFAWVADFVFLSFLFVFTIFFSSFCSCNFSIYFGFHSHSIRPKNCWPYLFHTAYNIYFEHTKRNINHLKWFLFQLIYQGVKSLASMCSIYQVKINCANVYVCIIRFV